MGIQINGQTDTISATDGSFTISGASGNLTGNLTGNVTGNVTGNLTGTASTATAAATAYGLSGSPTLSGITSVSTSNLTVNGTAYPATGPLSNRNKIINGDMRIDQRNDGASITVTSANFPVDRWKCREFSDGTATGQRVTDVPNNQFTNSLKYTVGTADSSLTGTQFGDCQQVIEGNNISDLGWGTSNAQTITVSFWVKSSVAGTYYVTPQNAGFNRTYPKNYTINSANTWEYKTLTIPGDTSGTWNTDNGVGMFLSWCVGTGPTYQGTANQWNAAGSIGASDQTNLLATSGAAFYLTGVQLEVGTVATPFEHRSYGDELARCLRYYWLQEVRNATSYGHFTLLSSYATTTDVRGFINFPVPMRQIPALSISDISHFAHLGGPAPSAFYLADGGASYYSTGLGVTLSSSQPANAASILRANNTNNAEMRWDAEL